MWIHQLIQNILITFYKVLLKMNHQKKVYLRYLKNFLGIKLGGIKPPQTATFDEVIIIFEFLKRIYTDTILQEKVQTNLSYYSDML